MIIKKSHLIVIIYILVTKLNIIYQLRHSTIH
jgi:hypothetical protein